MEKAINDIKVSVCCLTFNQEKYIEICLKSLLMQKTNFKFEIIVHDDASTDGTTEIVKRYAKLYPEIVKPIIEKENQYSQGGIPFIYCSCVYPHVLGEYVAYCEGDDFWTDPLKLQKQVEVLESNRECHMCLHYAEVTDEEGNAVGWGYPQNEIKTGMLSSYEFMKGLTDGYFFHTTSFLCRVDDLRILALNPPEFYKISDLDDVPLLIYFGQLGKNYYINEQMSCYRRDSKGSWTEGQKGNIEKIIKHKWCMIEVYKKYNEYTNGEYQKLVVHWINNERFMIAEYMHDYREMAKKKYAEFLNKRSIRFQIKVKMLSLFKQSVSKSEE